MTATIHPLPTRATRHTQPDTLRSDCERLMRWQDRKISAENFRRK